MYVMKRITQINSIAIGRRRTGWAHDKNEMRVLTDIYVVGRESFVE